MIDKSFVEKIESLVKQSITTEEIEGREYSAAKLNLIVPPQPSSLSVMSLNSLLEFVKLSDDSINTNYMFHVESPTVVSLVAKELNECAQRIELLEADVTSYINSAFDYGSAYNYEEFVVAVQCAFEQTEERNLLIDSISKISFSKEDDIADDGHTQTVSAKAGVVLKTTMALPNPIILKPFRSFPEIETKEQNFIFRIKKNSRTEELEFRLFESRSLVWELELVTLIKKYLSDNCSLEVI